MTSTEDAAIIESFKQAVKRYGKKTVWDMKSKKMIYVPQEVLDLEEASKREKVKRADPS